MGVFATLSALEAVTLVHGCVDVVIRGWLETTSTMTVLSEMEADRCILEGTGAFARGVYLSKAEMMTPGLFQSCTIMDKLNEAEEHEHGSMKDDMGWH